MLWNLTYQMDLFFSWVPFWWRIMMKCVPMKSELMGRRGCLRMICGFWGAGLWKKRKLILTKLVSDFLKKVFSFFIYKLFSKCLGSIFDSPFYKWKLKGQERSSDFGNVCMQRLAFRLEEKHVQKLPKLSHDELETGHERTRESSKVSLTLQPQALF